MAQRDEHPWIEIRIGTNYITQVPPRYIQSLVYTSSASGTDAFELDFIDPTFGELEAKLIDSIRRYIFSRGGNPGEVYAPMEIRWGFPAVDVWSSGENWWSVIVDNYTPTITASGIGMHITGYSTSSSARPSTTGPFEGRISDTVEQLFKGDSWVKTLYIEPTNDAFGTPMSIPSGMSRNQFVGEVLANLARSDLYPEQPYVFRVHGAARSVYFGPASKQPVMREFQVFVRQDPDVISFSPVYPAGALGSVIGTGSAANTFSPNQKEFKQFIASPLDRYVGMAKKEYMNRMLEPILAPAFSLTEPPTENQAKKIVKDQSPLKFPVISFNEVLEDTGRKFQSAWEKMYWLTVQAAAQHYGTLNTFNIFGGSQVGYTVNLPQGGTHWTSGNYFVNSATHRITGGAYLVDLEMIRLFRAKGAA